ncbi:MAG: hypothetical protein ABR510_10310 [Trueperaceae bacterium]
MSALSFGSVHVFVDTLEFELEQRRRQAARERLLRHVEVEGARPRRLERPTWRHPWPGSPHPRGAH